MIDERYRSEDERSEFSCKAEFGGALAMFTFIAFLIIAFTLGYGLCKFFSWRDASVAEAVSTYEKCVMEEYGMTPLQYQKDTGEMPECDYQSKK